jgi:hypothetical protein
MAMGPGVSRPITRSPAARNAAAEPQNRRALAAMTPPGLFSVITLVASSSLIKAAGSATVVTFSAIPTKSRNEREEDSAGASDDVIGFLRSGCNKRIPCGLGFRQYRSRSASPTYEHGTRSASVGSGGSIPPGLGGQRASGTPSVALAPTEGVFPVIETPPPPCVQAPIQWRTPAPRTRWVLVAGRLDTNATRIFG